LYQPKAVRIFYITQINPDPQQLEPRAPFLQARITFRHHRACSHALQEFGRRLPPLRFGIGLHEISVVGRSEHRVIANKYRRIDLGVPCSPVCTSSNELASARSSRASPPFNTTNRAPESFARSRNPSARALHPIEMLLGVNAQSPWLRTCDARRCRAHRHRPALRRAECSDRRQNFVQLLLGRPGLRLQRRQRVFSSLTSAISFCAAASSFFAWPGRLPSMLRWRPRLGLFELWMAERRRSSMASRFCDENSFFDPRRAGAVQRLSYSAAFSRMKRMSCMGCLNERPVRRNSARSYTARKYRLANGRRPFTPGAAKPAQPTPPA